MTEFPAFSEFVQALYAWRAKGRRIVTGTWGDGRTCGCPLTAVADYRGKMPPGGLNAETATDLFGTWPTLTFVCDLDGNSLFRGDTPIADQVADFLEAGDFHTDASSPVSEDDVAEVDGA